MTSLTLAFSPCPNDTFIFHALLHKLVDAGDYSFSPHIDDVEALNTAAFEGRFQITKLSTGAFLRLREKYELLDSGAAMGFGCGPLVVAAAGHKLSPASRIAVPGANTTALLLMKSWNPELKNLVEERFDRILPGVKAGKYDAGLIIHEGRFIYQNYGCEKLVDLGDWWERETGCPIPLGCLAIRKDPDTARHKENVERLIRDSVLHARAHPEDSRAFIRAHAPDSSDEIIDAHIKFYVNDYSVSLGETGIKAFKVLEERCKRNL